LPKDIETIANEIKVLEEKLNDPNLFTSNPDEFTRLTDEIYKKQTDQSNLEEILFEAEVAKEEFEG